MLKVRLHRIVREIIKLKKTNLLDHFKLLVACQSTTTPGRYIWNFHVHGKSRKAQKPFILIGISDPPMDDKENKFNFRVKYIFIVPFEKTIGIKTARYKDGVDNWLDECVFLKEDGDGRESIEKLSDHLIQMVQTISLNRSTNDSLFVQ